LTLVQANSDGQARWSEARICLIYAGLRTAANSGESVAPLF
jgi:hypothetical protein